jgi:hypothetical protein
MQRIILLFSLFLLSCSNPQKNDALQLLEKSISYHDPEGNWSKLKARLYLSSTDTAGKENPFQLEIDNATGYFCHVINKDGKEIVKGVSKGNEFFLIDGKADFSEEDRKKYKLTSESVKSVQNFYGYLYGLPMKLTDAGANISDTVSNEEFNGKTYQTIQVSYDPGMGKEVWTFFLDPKTSAIEAYRFMFSAGSDEGEYILLDETLTIDDIKIPKVRKWHFVKGNKYLGTDNLLKAEGLNGYRM